LAHLLVETILDKKGTNIVVLDVSEQKVFTDYFLLCDADNERQLKAMAASVAEDAKKKAEVRKLAIEGDPVDGWVLVDFGNLVVHLFSEEQRSYYKLEELWSMGHTVLRIQ
jgi:ribosome-associated protein